MTGTPRYFGIYEELATTDRQIVPDNMSVYGDDESGKSRRYNIGSKHIRDSLGKSRINTIYVARNSYADCRR